MGNSGLTSFDIRGIQIWIRPSKLACRTHVDTLPVSCPHRKLCFVWSKTSLSGDVREAPLRKMQGLFGHCPNGGGVSTLAQMVWGTYFEKNCPCSKGHLLGLGGLNPCQDGLGHLCSENWSSNGICSSRSGNKVPQSARLSEGGGVQSLFGQCPNRPGIFLTGASLSCWGLFVTWTDTRRDNSILGLGF